VSKNGRIQTVDGQFRVRSDIEEYLRATSCV